MTHSIPVHSSLERYRIASAELPASTGLSGDAAGAIVAVGGEAGWWDAAILAFREGAAGVVISRPVSVPAHALPAVDAAAAGRPVVFERPLLRDDTAALVVAAASGLPQPAAVVAESHAPTIALRSAVRDALGWARLVGGGPLVMRSADATRTGGVALLETAAGIPVSLVFAAQQGAPAWGRVRLTGLGSTLLELDGDDIELQFTMTDSASRRTAPARFERPERLTLRRAVQAVVLGERPSDLEDLTRDATLADEVTAASGL